MVKKYLDYNGLRYLWNIIYQKVNTIIGLEIAQLKDELARNKLVAGPGIDIRKNTISTTAIKTLWEVVTELPKSNINQNRIYVLPENGSYSEYIYVKNKWIKMGSGDISTLHDTNFGTDNITTAKDVQHTINHNVEFNMDGGDIQFNNLPSKLIRDDVVFLAREKATNNLIEFGAPTGIFHLDKNPVHGENLYVQSGPEYEGRTSLSVINGMGFIHLDFKFKQDYHVLYSEGGKDYVITDWIDPVKDQTNILFYIPENLNIVAMNLYEIPVGYNEPGTIYINRNSNAIEGIYIEGNKRIIVNIPVIVKYKDQ